MKIRWILLLCIAFIVTKTQSAAVPTTETLVVSKTDDEVSPTQSPSDAVTEEPNAPIKLTEMLVRSEVTMRYAHTAVVTHIRNPASKAQEATFQVLLPDTAFISGFVMTLDGKSYKAYVKEKNEAKKIFNEAVSQGAGAAHIAAKARDSNHFTVSVNVEPKSVAIFNLTYEELLVRRNGVYNHAINLHPGALVPKLEVVVHIKESQKITTLRVPEVRTGNEIDATDDDAQNSKAVQSRNGDKEATITFTPDLEEQMRLIKIYKDKTKDSGSHRYSRSQDEDEQRDGALGQFVVQYDVERSNNGEILVNDGYFVHFLAPSTLPALSKHVVFVLDTSSSMMGRKVEQLKAAMDAILSDLNTNDYFSIVEFNSDFSVHQLKEADEPVPERPKYSWYGSTPSNKELVSPALASPKNIAKAKVIISRLQATGGTNIYSALSVAIDLIHKFAGNNNIAKDDSKTNSTEQKEDTAVANSNDVKPKIINELEPIIIFLTDGDPTVGETSTSKIISHITEKNSGEMRASLYSLAFGEDADRNFLRKLSLRNEGFMRHIYEAADAALQLRDFYKQVSSPLLAHVKFTYPKEQIKEGSVSKHKFRTVYAGSEVVVAGELSDEASELAPVVNAFCGSIDGARVPYEDRPKIKVSRVKDNFLPLERLWAYLSIKQLLDERDAADQSAADKPEKKALALALKYSFVTPLTSLVVVKPNETNAVDAESVDKQDESFGIRPLSFNAMLPSPHYAASPVSFSSVLAHPLALQGGFADLAMLPQEEEDVYEGYDEPLDIYGNTNRNYFIDPIHSDSGISLHIIGNDMDNTNYDPRISGGNRRRITNMSNGRSNSNVFNFDNRVSGNDMDNTNYGSKILGGNQVNIKVAFEVESLVLTTCNNNLCLRITNMMWIYMLNASERSNGNGRSNSNVFNFDNRGNGMTNRNMITMDNTASRFWGGYGLRRRVPNGARFALDEDDYEDSGNNNADSNEDDWGGYGMMSRPFLGNSFIPPTTRPTAPSTTPAIFTTEVPDEKKYHLENYSWALGLLNKSADALTFLENGKQVVLELSTDANAPRSSPEESCSNAAGSASGPSTCVYVTRCAAARNITADDYRNSYCRVDHKYAGVCCPSSQIDATVA